MTATTAAPLETLAQQIERQQAELETLRQAYQTRQTRLADLTRRKEELQAQLQQVEADMQATTQGRPRGKVSVPAQPTSTTSSTASQVSSTAPAPQHPAPRARTLPALLVEIVRKAAGPVTVKQLADEVIRRRFPTTSGNIRRLVATRVKDLEQHGLLQRASGQPGVVLAPSAAGAKGPVGHGKPARKTSGTKGTVVTKAAQPAKPEGQSQRVPLRPLLVKLLAKSKRPLPARELADQVLASGYQTKSKNFVDVLWVALGQMDNVENVPGQGWRLKRR